MSIMQATCVTPAAANQMRIVAGQNGTNFGYEQSDYGSYNGVPFNGETLNALFNGVVVVPVQSVVFNGGVLPEDFWSTMTATPVGGGTVIAWDRVADGFAWATPAVWLSSTAGGNFVLGVTYNVVFT